MAKAKRRKIVVDGETYDWILEGTDHVWIAPRSFKGKRQRFPVTTVVTDESGWPWDEPPENDWISDSPYDDHEWAIEPLTPFSVANIIRGANFERKR
jgi:hypothetical protein